MKYGIVVWEGTKHVWLKDFTTENKDEADDKAALLNKELDASVKNGRMTAGRRADFSYVVKEYPEKVESRAKQFLDKMNG